MSYRLAKAIVRCRFVKAYLSPTDATAAGLDDIATRVVRAAAF